MSIEIQNSIQSQSIPFKVVEVTSEDPEFTAAELERNGRKGWQTAPDAIFPQHIIIAPTDEHEAGCFPVLNKIQILSHEKRIATKIEIFVRCRKNDTVEENDFDPVLSTYERLGYISFDSNEKNNYRARELKSIKLNDKACVTSIKFVVHGYYGNAYNPYSQVGIISFRLFSNNNKYEDVEEKDTFSDTNDEQNPNFTAFQDAKNEKESKKSNIRNQSTQYSISSVEQTLEESKPSKRSIQSRIQYLNELKIRKADEEDFEAAANIKSILTSLMSVITTYNEFHEAMKKAAEDEDYIGAATLKKKRDKLNQQLESALRKAEKEATLSRIQFDFNGSSINSNINDLSISTIRRNEEDDVSSIGMTMTAKSFPFDDRPIKPRQDMVFDTNEMDQDEAFSSSNIVEVHNNEKHLYEDGQHPLEGVHDYLSLPEPEEYLSYNPVMSKAPNTWSSHVSSDSILKIESVIGTYRTRCFLSKNWALREAAIVKLSLMFNGLVSSMQALHGPNLDWWDSFSRSICIILEKCLEDKVVQVFLSGCILFEDFICEMEKINLNPKEIQSVLSNAMILLISKIGDSNTKVEEATETLLMSLALSEVMGPSHIVSQVLKSSETEMKVVKAVCRRCVLLKDILKEFGMFDPSSVEKIVEFLEKFAINHKDAETRDAAKDLTVQLHLLDETSVCSIMNGFSDRQTKDFHVAFNKAAAIMRDDPRSSLGSLACSQNAHEDNHNLPNLVTDDQISPSPARRGRGRGRGRGKALML